MRKFRRNIRQKNVLLFQLKNVLMLIALLLVLSLSLHMVIPHHHAKDLFGEGLQAAFHGEDKKWWALFAALSLAFTGAFFVKKHSDSARSIFRHERVPSLAREFFCFFDPLRNALRRGIMHPKICG